MNIRVIAFLLTCASIATATQQVRWKKIIDAGNTTNFKIHALSVGAQDNIWAYATITKADGSQENTIFQWERFKWQQRGSLQNVKQLVVNSSVFGSNAFALTSHDDQIHIYRWEENAWKKIADLSALFKGKEILSFAVSNPFNLWLTTLKVYTWNGLPTATWHARGKLDNIYLLAAAPDFTIWGVQGKQSAQGTAAGASNLSWMPYAIRSWHNETNSWDQVMNFSESLTYFALSMGHAYAIWSIQSTTHTNKGLVYQWNPYTHTWESRLHELELNKQRPTYATHIAAGSDNTIWILTDAGDIYESMVPNIQARQKWQEKLLQEQEQKVQQHMQEKNGED